MIRHAIEQGVKVFEETRVISLSFNLSSANTERPVAAHWTNKKGESGTISFDWLIDASGNQGMMSTKYLKNRIQREGLRNVAVYGYWSGVKVFDKGGYRANAPWFEAMSGQSFLRLRIRVPFAEREIDHLGWIWVIPLHDGTTSIGVVMHENSSKQKKKAQPGQSLTEHYMEQLKFCPGVMDLIGDSGKFIEGSIKGTADYSYHATAYSGDHYRIIGDAAG